MGEVDTGGGTPEHWIVRKSTDGGATWNTIDDFQSDPATTSRAQGVTADAAGNIYVAGETSQRYVISTSKKGTTYGYTYQSVVRKSINGGASWVGDAQLSIGTFSSEVVGFGMGTDAAGQVYVVSPSCDASGVEHSIIRSNAGGAWQTVDDYQLASGIEAGGFGFAAGPDGTLYAAGYAPDSAGIDMDSSAQIRRHPLLRCSKAFPSSPAATNDGIGYCSTCDCKDLPQHSRLQQASGFFAERRGEFASKRWLLPTLGVA